MATPFSLYVDPKADVKLLDKPDSGYVSTADKAIEVIKASQLAKQRIQYLYITDSLSNAEAQKLNDWMCNNTIDLPVRVMWSGADDSLARKTAVRNWQQQLTEAVNGSQYDITSGARMAIPIQVENAELPPELANGPEYRLINKAAYFENMTYWDIEQAKIQGQWDAHVHAQEWTKGKINGSITFVNAKQANEEDAITIVKALHEPGKPPVAVPFLTRVTKIQDLLDMAAGLRQNIKFLNELSPTDKYWKVSGITDKAKEIKELDTEAMKYIAEAQKLQNDPNANEVAWVVGAHYE